MKLLHKQMIFAKRVALLIQKANDLGFEVTLGEALRSPEEAERLANLGVGNKKSLHISKLAIDLNLFRDGVYLTSTLAHERLGEWWESLSDDQVTHAWGGRFGDGNHYSIMHAGRK